MLRRRRKRYAPNRRPHVFLSHNSADKPFVRQLAGDLSNLGIDVWLDEWELKTGDPLHSTIGWALNSSRFVAVIISKSFLKSKWCLAELEQALAIERRQEMNIILPLLLETVQLPAFIEGKVYLDFSKDYFSSLFRVSAQLHGLQPVDISFALSKQKPQTFDDVSDLLKTIGWDGYINLFDEEFKKLKIALEEEGFYLGKDSTINIDDEVLIKLQDKLPPTLQHLITQIQKE